jgi:hypothetical protein
MARLAPPLPRDAAAEDAAVGDAASTTLGDILQHDDVMRQSAHIRASMEARGTASAPAHILQRDRPGRGQHDAPQHPPARRHDAPIRAQLRFHGGTGHRIKIFGALAPPVA